MNWTWECPYCTALAEVVPFDRCAVCGHFLTPRDRERGHMADRPRFRITTRQGFYRVEKLHGDGRPDFNVATPTYTRGYYLPVGDDFFTTQEEAEQHMAWLFEWDATWIPLKGEPL